MTKLHQDPDKETTNCWLRLQGKWFLNGLLTTLLTHHICGCITIQSEKEIGCLVVLSEVLLALVVVCYNRNKKVLMAYFSIYAQKEH